MRNSMIAIPKSLCAIAAFLAIQGTQANPSHASCAAISAHPLFGQSGATAISGVYAAGHEGFDALVWLNGKTLYKLNEEGYGAKANSIAVHGRDVFVAGFEINAHGMTAAKVWKNGEPLYSFANAVANSICVSGGNVYAAGYVFGPKGKGQAIAWKNGQALYPLTDGKTWASASSVYVSGGNVYVAGNEGKSARVWKNGEPLYRLGKKNAAANSVYVSDGNVYVAGFEKKGGKVWRNGVEVYSSMMEDLSSVFVYDKEVHVAGSWRKLAPKHQAWKEESAGKNDAEMIAGHGWSVFAQADDVYLAGYECGRDGRKNQAIVWKNGEELFRLTDGRHDAEARSVFVK